jgi:hypothetical protein
MEKELPNDKLSKRETAQPNLAADLTPRIDKELPIKK